MNRAITARSLLKDERGLTLVEILIAVTIMSIISVSIMGYFVTSVQRSADESRRIIAANLARLKAAEMRDMARSNDVNGTDTNYSLLLGAMSGSTAWELSEGSPLPSAFQARYPNVLNPDSINGTTYTYRITLYKEGPRRATLNGQMSGRADRYVARMSVHVAWRTGSGADSSAGSTTLDTYLIERGE